MNLIKNQTPYKGRIFLKFEKNPHYTSGGGEGMLNKVHLNLGFIKLVSRMVPNRDLEGYIIDQEKVDLINKFTWGKIGDHRNDKGDFNLTNSFLAEDGSYIGDVKEGWKYYKNNLIVCKEYPCGVAIKLKTYTPNNSRKNSIKDPYENYITEQTENDNVVGYYGYTHRGGQTFKIGDRLFQEDYKPKREDYPEKEWAKYEKKFQKSLSSAKDDLEKKWMDESGISYVIPFKKIGPKVIETWDEALQAAVNMSRYLS